ncbi:perforin-1-like [Carcharodon carcharias]|uniref:perforin-1-like n=1 Tax=Carcharodon carcharias TaxID=13397 RepID=UPI001B7DBB2A|nr:perforin-1-like [Carcharodon carcharias]
MRQRRPLPLPRTPPLLLLLLLLLPGGASSTCEVGTANECKRAAPVPGASLAGEGYDVVRLAPTGAHVVNAHSWRRADGTCTLCRNELMGGAGQRLPRAVSDWGVRQDCSRRLRSTLYESASELAGAGDEVVDRSWSARLDVRPKPGSGASAVLAGAKSRAVNFAHRRSASDRYSYASQSVRCQLYHCRLRHRPPLAPQFVQLLRTLPPRLAPHTRFFYERFLRTFGTHYITGVSLGGSFRDVTAVRTCQAAAEGQTAEEVRDVVADGSRPRLEVLASPRMERGANSPAQLDDHGERLEVDGVVTHLPGCSWVKEVVYLESRNWRYPERQRRELELIRPCQCHTNLRRRFRLERDGLTKPRLFSVAVSVLAVEPPRRPVCIPPGDKDGHLIV